MRIARSTGAVSGLLIAVLGIWGALIPFAGPYFDYSFETNTTWHYTADRLWLCILPGALALLGGVLLLTATTRSAGRLGGWLALIAGAWFIVGPAVSLTWESGPGPIGRPLFGSTRQMLELIGCFYGLGALILALAAFAIGRFAPPRAWRMSEAATAAEPTATTPANEPASAQSPAPSPSQPVRRRRLPIPRRRGSTGAGV